MAIFSLVQQLLMPSPAALANTWILVPRRSRSAAPHRNLPTYLMVVPSWVAQAVRRQFLFSPPSPSFLRGKE